MSEPPAKKRSRGQYEADDDDTQSGGLFPSSALDRYCRVSDWKSYIATGHKGCPLMLELMTDPSKGELMANTIIALPNDSRVIQKTRQQVWMAREATEVISERLDVNINALEYQLAVAKEAKAKLEETDKKDVQHLEQLFGVENLAPSKYSDGAVFLLCNKLGDVEAWSRLSFPDIQRGLKLASQDEVNMLKNPMLLLNILYNRDFHKNGNFQRHMQNLKEQGVFARTNFKIDCIQRSIHFNRETQLALVGIYLQVEGSLEPHERYQKYVRAISAFSCV